MTAKKIRSDEKSSDKNTLVNTTRGRSSLLNFLL